MLKKTCAATGLLIGAAAGALFMSSPAHAGGDKNVNINKIYNVNENKNSNDNDATATASLSISIL